MSVLLYQVWITPIPYQFQGKTFDESAYHGAHSSWQSDTPAAARHRPFIFGIAACGHSV
jgi:hypothetical protein